MASGLDSKGGKGSGDGSGDDDGSCASKKSFRSTFTCRGFCHSGIVSDVSANSKGVGSAC